MISIIIPCKNHILFLKKNIEALFSGNNDNIKFEVIVVVSGNADGIESLKLDFPSLKIIESIEPLNPGSARNLGSEIANGSILAFLDADCIPDANWLKSIVKSFQNHAVIVGGAIKTINKSNLIALSDNLIHFYLFSTFRPFGKAAGIAGANFCIKKTVFTEFGGFPDHRISEDWTLSKEIANKYPDKSFFDPTIIVSHFGRDSIASFHQHQYMHGYARGKYKIEVSDKQQYLGRYLLMIPLIIARRLFSIYSKTIEYRRFRVLGIIFLLPTVVFGLTSWSFGFRKGCKDYYER